MSSSLAKVRVELEASRHAGDDESVAALMVVRRALETSASVLLGRRA